MDVRSMLKKQLFFACLVGLSRAQAPALDKLQGVENLVSVLVVGSGPAGYAAAVHGARAGFDTLVIEGRLPGGQLTQTRDVENWPGVKKNKGPLIMAEQRQQVLDAGASIMSELVTAVDLSRWPFMVTLSDGTVVHALALICATGSQPDKLGVPGEGDYWGRGVSTCAVCDAPLYKRKQVVIVGGGDSAVEEALQLSMYAKKVTLLVRRDQLRASWAMQRKLDEVSAIEVCYNKSVTGVIGDGDSVTALDVMDARTKQIDRMTIDGVFLAIGHKPCSALVAQQVQCDEQGYVVLKGRSQQTSVAGVFAAGEVADSVYRQAAVAAGDGSKAGRDAERFLYEIECTPLVVRELKKNGTRFFVNPTAS